MDVTEQIRSIRKTYGGSYSSSPESLAVSKNLNYAKGASIRTAPEETVTVIPFTLNYKDSVGLFGAENTFIKVNVDIIDSNDQAYEEEGWISAEVDQEGVSNDSNYVAATRDYTVDTTTVLGYDPAEFIRDLSVVWDPMVSIDVDNKKTGNIYNDNWFDVRLYTKNREEHPFNEMFLKRKDFFYIGFHARNTRRIPYNVDCTIGNKYVSSTDIVGDDKMLIARTL